MHQLLGQGGSYSVVAIVAGREVGRSRDVTVWRESYLEVPLDKPPNFTSPGQHHGLQSYTYVADDASVGDVDGDGVYELIVKWDPTNSKDNALNNFTGPVFIDAYTLDGTRLWRINLGTNIRAGPHYTQFMVYDLDGDGRAEVAMRTGDGTVDGVGRVLGNGSADHRNSFGHILQGPEYLTVFSGYTGEALATVDFAPPRGSVEDWGDKAGNRSDRFLAAIAYLDGERPSLVMTRGYYNQTQLAAYDYRNGSLSKRWLFKADANVHPLYRGQGNHHLNVADVDMDGKDEIVFGAMVIDDDGSGLYSTAWGHGDALHTADVDPNRPGLEICQVHEKSRPLTLTCRDAATGQELWSIWKEGLDSGRCVVADIDPRYPGQEVWARYLPGLYSATGEMIAEKPPPTYNFGIWWDGDLLRELLDNITIYKWDHVDGQLREIMTAHGTNTNSQKATPSLQADLLGDWREEVVWRTVDSTALRIYTTTHETTHRIPTLMHDHQYRMSIAWQNVGYNQMPHPSYYLGSSTT